jgi:hypothetical protein
MRDFQITIIYHDCYTYFKIFFLFPSRNKNISNKKWKNSMKGFITVVINIWKSFSYSLSGNFKNSNKKWRNSMINFITFVINILKSIFYCSSEDKNNSKKCEYGN